MIKYTDGYQYQLVEKVACHTTIRPPVITGNQFITLYATGFLVIEKGYAWDGASGGWDTKTFMRGSLVHDALCQLINEGLLPKHHQETADNLLKEICIEDGMSSIRAWWVHCVVRRYDKSGLKNYKQKEILMAP